MLEKLHLICMEIELFHAQIRCNLKDNSYLSEMQKNKFQFLQSQLLSLFFLLSIFNYVFLNITFSVYNVLRI